MLGGFAMFSLKDSSLLSYVKQYKERRLNLQNVYGVKNCPSDGAMRTILDKIEVNMVWYEERDGATDELLKKNCFITDIDLHKQSVKEVVKVGRSRWKIENETFNTLKNQGYNFTHNYGHGKEHLSTVFCILMMLAFTIDQIAQACDKYFKRAWRVRGSKKSLWEKVRQYFDFVVVKSMETIYKLISKDIKLKIEQII